MSAIVSADALRVISGIVDNPNTAPHFPVIAGRRDVFTTTQADAFVERRARELSRGSDRLYNIARTIDMAASEIDDYPDMRVHVAQHVRDLSTETLLALAGRPAVDLVAYVLLSQAASFACANTAANTAAFDYLVRAFELEEHTDCVRVADCGFYGEVGEQILLMLAESIGLEDEQPEGESDGVSTGAASAQIGAQL